MTRLALSIIAGAAFILLIPVAALYQLYDWLEDRTFEREMNRRYGDALSPMKQGERP